ncbi:hypothetical protein O181_057465 [Austropuccinia psidii MF-1]|uniref:Uncharacterized protein n=1 Tax=Austropuccinia psidii MF-1 TaxID=1389203 RepID=A0A9Q3HX12_9BASI|nr:hypothetical protein [Austropuccinia psidii MF-1]
MDKSTLQNRFPLSYEHNSPNTQREMGKSEDLGNELTKNKFHLISAINISTGWTVSMDDATAFTENWKTFCLSNNHLLPKQRSKPNPHFASHIPKLFQFGGSEQSLAIWGMSP